MTPEGPSTALLGLDLLSKIKKDQLRFYADMQDRYGDIVPMRLGPYRSILMFHPEQIEAVLATQASSFIRFERLMNVLKQWNGNSLLIAEGESWKERRRKVLPSLASRRMPEYAETIADEVERFANKLSHKAASDGEIVLDADPALAGLALSIAIRTLFGEGYEDQLVEIIDTVHDLSDIAFVESTSPFVLPDILPLAIKTRKKAAISKLKGFIRELVADGLARPAGNDLLSILIETHQGDKEAIKDDVVSLMIAGHETSGAALSWIFALSARYPDKTNWLREELDAAIKHEKSAYEFGKLLRLRAFIAEVLRLYPPAYTLFLRQAVEDVTLPNIQLKRGDLVQIVPYITGRDTRFFESPLSFEPERHLRDRSWPQYAFLPFGAGPRVCIGQAFGMLELAIATTILLRRFSLQPIKEMPEPEAKFSLRPKSSLPMIWRERGPARS
ncbi:MAG: cytochrome P450 [Pseudomonadota bacterium]